MIDESSVGGCELVGCGWGVRCVMHAMRVERECMMVKGEGIGRCKVQHVCLETNLDGVAASGRMTILFSDQLLYS